MGIDHRASFLAFWNQNMYTHQMNLQNENFEADFEMIQSMIKVVRDFFLAQSECQGLKPHTYLHTLYKNLAFHYNRKKDIQNSLTQLEESNLEAL
jgi:hypothetical protein